MNILFDVYDSVGGVSINSRILYRGVKLTSGEVNIDFPSIRIVLPEFYILLIYTSVCINIFTGNSQSQAQIWVEADIGEGFQAVQGAAPYIYGEQVVNGYGFASIATSFQINKLNNFIKFRVRAKRVICPSSLVTGANASNSIGMVNLD